MFQDIMERSRYTRPKRCPKDKNPQSWLLNNQLLPEKQVPVYWYLAKLSSVTAQQISSAHVW